MVIILQNGGILSVEFVSTEHFPEGSTDLTTTLLNVNTLARHEM